MSLMTWLTPQFIAFSEEVGRTAPTTSTATPVPVAMKFFAILCVSGVPTPSSTSGLLRIGSRCRRG